MLLGVYDVKETIHRSKTAVPSPHVKRMPPQGVQSVVQLGLRANWQQFTLLVIVNAFVGGMVGLERSIVPLLGQRAFGLASTTAVLSFILSFGVVEARPNARCPSSGTIRSEEHTPQLQSHLNLVCRLLVQ